jgi:Mor family transcriptional regulator
LDVLAEVERRCGVAAALRLAHRLGGLSVYIPKRPPAWHPVAEAVGGDVLTALAQIRGGESITIPTGRRLIAAQRDRAILERRSAGASIGDIAHDLGCCRRAVYLALARARRAGTPSL